MFYVLRTSSPTPRVTWARQGADMPTRKREDSFGQELVIENIDFADAGKYECEGINEISPVPIRRSFSLSVECKLLFYILFFSCNFLVC